MEGESIDPAADFLAREQEELGELGEELGINANPAEAVTEAADDPDVPQTVEDEVAVVDQMTAEMRISAK